MSPPNHSPWSVRWELSDPFGSGNFSVRITVSELRHVRNDHITSALEGPLWDDVLGRELADRLRIWTPTTGIDPTNLEQVAALLREQLEQGLARPLVVAYEQRDPHGNPMHNTVEVATPSGLIFVLVQEGSSWLVKTIYFANRAGTVSVQRRWLAAVESVVEKYAEELSIAGRSYRVPLGPRHAVPSCEPAGDKTNIRFVSMAQWGFHPFEYEGETLHVWKHPPPWSVQASAKNPLRKPKKADSGD